MSTGKHPSVSRGVKFVTMEMKKVDINNFQSSRGVAYDASPFLCLGTPKWSG